MRKLIFYSLVLMLQTGSGCKKGEMDLHNNMTNEVLSGNSGSGTGNSKKFGTVKDIDGNTYKTVTIGTQVWMAQNLRVGRYNNGDSIKNILDIQDWRNTTEGAWCHFVNSVFLDTVYGKLYNWFAIADPRGIAPKGWRVPTLSDYQVLVNYLGGTDYAGSSLKEASLLWTQPNLATNNSGFSARPGGGRDSYYGDFIFFYKLNETGFYWTSSPATTFDAFFLSLLYNSPAADLSYASITTNGNMKFGGSIRCIKN